MFYLSKNSVKIIKYLSKSNKKIHLNLKYSFVENKKITIYIYVKMIILSHPNFL